MRKTALFFYRAVKPLCDPVKFLKAIPLYIKFFADLIKYFNMETAERFNLISLQPEIHNRSEGTRFDPHYLYSNVWAYEKISRSGVARHVDVGSKVDFVALLSTVTRVDFIDIRPVKVQLENFNSMKGGILSMPFKESSVRSLSCLHVAEHIGLGRYGGTLDPLGTVKACRELARVLARGGDLYLSMPVGRPRVCFNAHRIHSPKKIAEYFSTLRLIEFSGIDDNRNFIRQVDMKALENSEYACGLFHFRKPL